MLGAVHVEPRVEPFEELVIKLVLYVLPKHLDVLLPLPLVFV